MIEQALEKRQILLSVVSVGEFLVAASEAETAIVDEMIVILGIISIDRAIMDQAVVFRQHVLRKSKRVLLLDCFIAATAKLRNATLLTFDRRDYPFSGIKVKEPQELHVSSL